MQPCDNLKVRNALVKSLGTLVSNLLLTAKRRHCRTLAHLCIPIPRLFQYIVTFHTVLLWHGSVTTGSTNITIRRHFSHKGVVTLSDNCRVPSHFVSLISLRVTHGARPPPTRSAKRQHEVTKNTCQVSHSFCKQHIHLKFGTM